MSRPELWGGIECTVNRVGDAYFDEVERSGHARRAADLERFASLGIRTMRYPILWERTAPADPALLDWRWPDERLTELKRLGIDPIVGLLHHGSGPRHTSLIDPAFPEKFAGFAAEVARRYPWIEAYTPINEPLTTARFSALYGLWYPHGRSDALFVRALLAQCRATVLAVRRIRAVNERARLVQTDDLGKVYSTARLHYQAEFENERRWLAWDLVCGRVGRDHPLFEYLTWAGATERELGFFEENPCPPDVVGINYYITSERFLDHRVSRYPEENRGGNSREAYADVEAVRVCSGRIAGHSGVLREAWERYGLPIALTELHLGCARGDQLRWFHEGWSASCELRDQGVDVRAVTAWSLLGSHDWSSLRTDGGSGYEPGVFDVRAPEPRPTAIARFVQAISAGETPDHPVLDLPGWWHRHDRWAYPRARPAQARGEAAAGRTAASTPRFVLITGATGTLGRAFARICEQRGIAYRITDREELDIADRSSVARAVRARPWALVNTAGYVRVDDAERDADRCFRENADGPALLAEVCASEGIPLLTFSSDLVFDGERTAPYLEHDEPAPLSVYGASKAAAESRVLEVLPEALVVRAAAFFGPWDEHNFLARGLSALMAGQPWYVDAEDVVSPTYVPDLVNASLDLLIDGESGIWHLANGGAVSWPDFARQAAGAAGLPVEGIIPTSAEGPRARRARFSALGSMRGALLPPLRDALHRYLGVVRLPIGMHPNLVAAVQ